MGKARVVPLKVITILRLELAAAVLAARIDRMLKRELELTLTDSIFWMDSTSVRKYILNDTCRFQTYQLSEISLTNHSGATSKLNSILQTVDQEVQELRLSPDRDTG